MTSPKIPPPPRGRDTRRRQAARAGLAATLWDAGGRRRLPTEQELVQAIEACAPGDLWWTCEASSAGPVYQLPTVEWLDALLDWLDGTGAASVLEVACGDGFLSECIARRRPQLQVTATDDASWGRPAARMTDVDRAQAPDVAFAGITPGAHVVKMGAVAAVNRYVPDVVIVSWPPPGRLVDRVITAPSSLVLDISTDGDICGNGMGTWRFEKEFLEGPIEDRALCRLDERPSEARATRVTEYYGKRHPRHARSQ